MNDSDESGFSSKEISFYMWWMETIRMALTWDTMLPLLLILFSFCFVSQSTFQPRALTSALQPPVTVAGLPLPLVIIYWSGSVDCTYCSSLDWSFFDACLPLSFFFLFIDDVDSNHSASTVLYTQRPRSRSLSRALIPLRLDLAELLCPTHPRLCRHQIRTVASNSISPSRV